MGTNLNEFLKLVESDPAWLDQLKAAPSKETAVELCLAKAKELGVELSDNDFATPEGELSEDELASVAGGGECFCDILGGGTSDDSRDSKGRVDEACGCVVGGYGSYDNNGDSETRCVCAQLGAGASFS